VVLKESAGKQEARKRPASAKGRAKSKAKVARVVLKKPAAALAMASSSVSVSDRVTAHFPAYGDVLGQIPERFQPKALRGSKNYNLAATCGSNMTVRLDQKCVWVGHACHGGQVAKPNSFSFSRYGVSGSFERAVQQVCQCPLEVWGQGS